MAVNAPAFICRKLMKSRENAGQTCRPRPLVSICDPRFRSVRIASAFQWVRGTTEFHRALSVVSLCMLCLSHALPRPVFLWDRFADPHAGVTFIPLNFLWSISTCRTLSRNGLGAQLFPTPSSVIRRALFSPRLCHPKPGEVFPGSSWLHG